MENEKSGLSLPVLLSLVAGFFTLSGGLWHLGYWSTFKFNYFEYASLTDLFKSSFYPFAERIWLIIGVISLSACTSLWGKYSFRTIKESSINKEREAKYNRRLNIFGDSVISICLFIVAYFTLLTSHSPYRFVVLPIVISIGSIAFLLRYNVFDSCIKNTDLKFLVVLLVSTYPTCNFFIGKITSNDIFNNKKGVFIVGFKSNDKILNKNVMGKPYLGSSTEYHFVFLGGLNDICVIKKDIVENLTLASDWLHQNPSGFKSYEEILLFEDTSTIKIDTTKTYYDPSLKIKYDSSFRQVIRENLLKN